MRYSSFDRSFPAGGPLASALVIIVGSLVIAASIVIGFFAFVILGSLLLILAAVVSIRLWWYRRELSRNPALRTARAGRHAEDRETIEGEYRVVVEETEERRD